MRILMLNNELPPLGGGTGTVNLALLHHFAQAPGLEIDLITSAEDRQAYTQDFSPTIRIYKEPVGKRNIHHFTNRELMAYALRSLPLALRMHARQRYDLVFAWSAVPGGGVALALRKLVGLRYLVRVCGPDIPGFEQRYQGLYPLLTPVIKAIWRGAEVVVAKCEGEAAMIRQVDPGARIKLAPNGVDRSAFQAACPGQQAGPLRILCVARLIERKGQRHLIQALRRLQDSGLDASLDLVGTGDAQPEYEALAQELGVAGLVKFWGYVPREVIAPIYAAADVFVLPSYNEGMSVAALEAMAAGLPLVVTRTGGTDELVENGVNGLVFDWADIDTLVEHLQRLVLDRRFTAAMGAASRQRAERFSWEAAAGDYLRLFAALLPAAAGAKG